MQRIADLFNIFDNKEDNIATVAIYKNALTDFSLWRRGATNENWIQEAWDQIGNDDDRTVDDVLICRYAYGSTVHSAQGGEWDTVALLLDGKSKNDTARFGTQQLQEPKRIIYIKNRLITTRNQVHLNSFYKLLEKSYFEQIY